MAQTITKGDYGYLRRQQQKIGLLTGVLYAVALIMYFTAKAYFKTNQNLFTILAVVVLLPAAKQTVNLIMLLRAGECPDGIHQKVERHVGSLDAAYDLYFTSEKKNFNIRHLAVGGKSIAAYSNDPKCDPAAGEQHIRQMLQANGIHGYQVKIFTNLSSYLTRVDQLRELESEGQADHEKLFALLYRITL